MATGCDTGNVSSAHTCTINHSDQNDLWARKRKETEQDKQITQVIKLHAQIVSVINVQVIEREALWVE